MAKHLNRFSVLAACCGLVISAANFARADDPKMSGDKPAAPGAADQKAMMDAMMKAGEPGPEHEKMKEEVGDWNSVVKMAMPDGSLKQVSEGTMHVEMMMDRFVTMKTKATMDMGTGPMPFEGFGMHGYDNMTKKYWSIWVDSTGTGLMKTEGTMQDGKVVLTGDMVDPMSGKPIGVKEVITHPDATHSGYEMYIVGPGGKEMKEMEIQYSKK